MTVPGRSFAVVLPAHNSSENIGTTVSELAGYFRSNALNGEVVVVENGSTDDTWEVMQSIRTSDLPFRLVLARSDKGLGNAIRRGMELVSADLVLITADDLPFGFSDIDGYFALADAPDIAIGSKAHPGTSGDRSVGREIMSTVFRLLRRIVVKVDLGDTQGTIMGDAPVISRCSSRTRQPGYLMTTELLAHAVRDGASIVELPVVYRRELRGSNINVVSDSVKMVRGLFEVRAELRRSIS